MELRLTRNPLRASLITASALFTIVLAACSSGSSSDPETTADSEYLQDYLDLLALIPDTEDSRFAFTMSSYAMATNLAGVQTPSDRASDEDVLRFLVAGSENPDVGIFTAAGPFVSGWGGWATFFVETRDERGFDGRDVRAAAVLSQSDGMEFAVGDFLVSEFAANVTCASCGNPQELSHGDETWFSWGSDANIDRRLTPPVFDRLGRGANWWVTDDSAVRTITTDEMRDVIDASNGSQRSLADLEQYTSVVEAMAAMNTYSMFLTTSTFRQVPDLYLPFSATQAEFDAFVANEYSQIPALRAYSLLAIGAGLDDRGHYTTVAMSHADEATARDSEKRLGRVLSEVSSSRGGAFWSETFPEFETEIRGSVLAVKLRGTKELPVWLDIVNFYALDNLLVVDDAEPVE